MDVLHAIAFDPRAHVQVVPRHAKVDLDGALADFTKTLELDPKNAGAAMCV